MLVLEIVSLTGVGSAAVGAVITIIGSFTIFITSILKNTSLQDTVMKYFAKSLNKEIIDKSDIDHHEIFIKLDSLINHSYFVKDFVNVNKAKLFIKYTEIIAAAYKKNLLALLDNDLSTFTEQSLKMKVHSTMLNIYNEIDTNLYNHLKTLNHDTKKLNTVTNKIKAWRTDIKVIIELNIMNVASSGKYVSTEFKLDKIFNVLSLGFDFILKNGADTFNKLNGELDDFLKEDN